MVDDAPPDWLDDGSILDSLPEPRPAQQVPGALLPMIAGRGAFATLWRKDGGFGRGAWIEAIALELAGARFDHAGIAAALTAHPTLRLSPRDAQRAAAAAVDAVRPGHRDQVIYGVRFTRWFRQTPALFELHVDGETVMATAVHVSSRRALLQHCIGSGKVPELPISRDYDTWLREQIAGAEVVEQPEEASDTGAWSEFVAEVFDGLPYHEDPSRLGDGCHTVADGYMVVRASVIWRTHIEREAQGMTRQVYYHLLRGLGWAPHMLRHGTDTLRTWRRPFVGDPPPSARAEVEEATRKRAVQASLGDVIDRPFYDDDEDP